MEVYFIVFLGKGKLKLILHNMKTPSIILMVFSFFIVLCSSKVMKLTLNSY